MKRNAWIVLLLVVCMTFTLAACKSNKSDHSREYIPGKGWVPVD